MHSRPPFVHKRNDGLPGPQGEQGLQGDQGDQGLQGEPGITSDWPIVKDFIADTETLTIPARWTLVVPHAMYIEVGGTLDNAGTLALI